MYYYFSDLQSPHPHYKIFKLDESEIPDLVNFIISFSFISLLLLGTVALFIDPFYSLMCLATFFFLINETAKIYFNRYRKFSQTISLNLIARASTQLGRVISGHFLKIAMGLIHFEVLGKNYKNNDPNSEEEIWIPIMDKDKN